MAAALGGCRCGTDPTPEACGDLTVTFDSPADGAVVPQTVNVAITAKGDGGTLTLTKASISHKLSSGGTFSDPVGGTLNGDKATFSSVQLDVGTNLLKATVENVGLSDGGVCSGTQTISVLVEDTTTGDPDVTSFKFQQDTNDDKLITAAELPKASTAPITALITTVRATDPACRVDVVDRATQQTYLSGPVTVVNGVATVSLTGLSNPTTGSFTLQAKINCPSKTHDAPNDPEANVVLTVDRVPPTCGLDAPNQAVLGPNDDADTTRPGFQLRTIATLENGTTGELSVTGTLADGGMVDLKSGMRVPVNGIISQDFDIPDSGTTSYKVSFNGVDDAGNGCTAQRDASVDFDPPIVVLTSPTADGGSPYIMQTLPLTATVVGGEPGSVKFVSKLDGGDVVIKDLVPVVGGFARDAGTFPLGRQIVRAEAIDEAGNVGHSQDEGITVGLPANTCSILFTRPATKPAFITANQLVGGNYNIQATSNCVNEPVTLTIDGINPVVANTNASGVASWNVPVVDRTYTFHVKVGPVGNTNDDEVVATVNTTSPNITAPIPGAMPPAVLNAAQDVNRAVAGVQRTLSFTGSVASGGRFDICSNQTPAPTGSSPCPDNAAGWWVMKTGATSPENGFTFPEGTYDIKVVAVSGSATVASNPVSLFVDGVLPSVTNVAFPQEQGTPDKKLNLAELATQAPRVTFTLAGADSQATIAGIFVRVHGSTTAFNTFPADVAFSGQNVTVTLSTGITTTEADYDWDIVVTDRAGNSNVIGNPTVDDPLNAAAILTGYRVDKQAPTCALLDPSGTLYGGPDDVDTATAGFQLRARASTSADVATVKFDLTGTATNTASPATSGGIAQNDFTVTDGTYTVTATCVDSSGNPAPPATKPSIVVDLTPPTCSITAPAAGGYSSFSIPTDITVNGAAGRPVTVRSSGQATPLGTLTVTGTSAAGTLSYPSGTQNITADVTDAAGNSCTTAPVAITVNAMGCSISFVSPVAGASGKAFINKSADTTPATPTSADFVVTGHSSNCMAGQAVTLFNATGSPTSLGTGTVNASGDVTINALLAEGGPYTLRLTINNGTGLLTSSDLANVVVDLTAPTVAAVTPTGTSLKFVAAGNPNIGSAGYVADVSPGAPADFNVTATTIAGAVGGTLRVLYQGTAVASADITTDPQSVAGLAAQLTHNTTGTFQIEVSDEAGNAIRPVDTTAVVDVIAPAAPTVAQSLGDPRAATVNLQWDPTYDDGSDSSSGAHAGYDIRWTTASVTAGNNLATSADYFDSTRAFVDSLVPHSASQIAKSVTVPPLNTYYIAVRAKDEVGNYSPYTAPAAVANPGTLVTLSNPTGTASQTFGNSIYVNGSIDGDAFDDVVAGNSSVNLVYVYFGSATFASQTACDAAGTSTASSTCQTIAHPNAVVEGFGTEIAVGNFGDTAAADIAVSALGFNASPYFGRTFLFFGGARPINTASYVEIRGEVSNTFFGRPFTVPDVNADGFNELAISAPASSGVPGAVFIFKGRSKTAWDALRDGTDTFVKSSKADWIIDGPSPSGANGNNFGQTRGIVPLGATADGGVAFTVAAAADRVNQVFAFSATELLAAAGGTVHNTPANAYQTLNVVANSPGGTASGLGTAAVGNLNFTGALALRDLVLTQPRNDRAFVFADGTPVTFPASPTLTINGVVGTSFGVALAAADFNGDSANDLLCTESSATPGAWALFNHGNTFESQAGTAFWFSKFYVGPTAGIRGLTAVVGDLDGDSKRDFVVGDRLSSPGKVVIWH
ncbi:MAG: VCBS repeat-containing protein [Archangiaceae bacterium]|nr:VCBS repeat-containing protein [Archangiaceae bacterium]